MNRPIDCDVLQDQLDSYKLGILSEEGIEQLWAHARSCSDCNTVLKLHEQLAARSLAELEAMVPNDFVATMWPRVKAELARLESRHGRRLPARWRRWDGWVPAMAAASVLLLIGIGYLFGELRQLRDREETLIQQVAEQQRWLGELDARTSPSAVARTAGLAGSSSWERMLARLERVTVSELEELLAGVPASTTIVAVTDVDALRVNLPYWAGIDRNELLDGIGVQDGLQAGEMLELLSRLDIDPRVSISTGRILTLSRRAVRQGRS